MAGIDVDDMVCAHGRKFNEVCPGCPSTARASRYDTVYATEPAPFTGLYLGNEHVPGLPSAVVTYEERPDNALIGIGGGPTRTTILPTSAADRKKYPIATGLLDYFPDALAAISNLSYVGNEQHNPGQPVHWARGKSSDEADTMMRHFLQRGTVDADGIAHSVKMAWRALALLQKELETK